MIVNKPAGMVVHPAFGNYNGTLVNALMFHCESLPHTKGNEIRPGLVHRIDKDTSGLLVISKTDFSATHLSNQFFYHTIERTYQALVWGDFEKDRGTVKGYINRHKSDRKKMDIYSNESLGKRAVTHYKVLERLGNVTLIECKLETGRTHQIRAHMKHIGHPLFADEMYGGKSIVKGIATAKYGGFIENCFTLMPRQALHAKSLGFEHPTTKEKIYFESELPEDFASVLEKWRKFVK